MNLLKFLIENDKVELKHSSGEQNSRAKLLGSTFNFRLDFLSMFFANSISHELAWGGGEKHICSKSFLRNISYDCIYKTNIK